MSCKYPRLEETPRLMREEKHYPYGCCPHAHGRGKGGAMVEKLRMARERGNPISPKCGSARISTCTSHKYGPYRCLGFVCAALGFDAFAEAARTGACRMAASAHRTGAGCRRLCCRVWQYDRHAEPLGVLDTVGIPVVASLRFFGSRKLACGRFWRFYSQRSSIDF